MDLEKIGKFIKLLREQKKWTQEELAEKLTIGRTAVSKWERGTTIPDPSILIKLSEVFEVTINEILMGHREEKNLNLKDDNVTFELYKRNFKNKKLIKLLISIIVTIMIIFLGYYFIISFKSTKVYSVSGYGENVNVDSGFLIYTKEKYYFSIGNISLKNNEEIKKLELYIKYKDAEMKLLNAVDDKYLFIIDLNGYNEYELSNFVKTDYKTFVKVYYTDTYELIELKYIKDYENDFIIPFKVNSSTKSLEVDERDDSNYNEIELFLRKMKDELNLDDEKNYSKEFSFKNNNAYISYNIQNSTLNLIFEKNNESIEIWNYNVDLNSLAYTCGTISYLYNSSGIQCLSGICDEWEEKNNEFWEVIFYLTND